jgi:ligand-binding SRPBCC domain-containing protein
VKTSRLTREQLIPLPVEEVFAFFADPQNLELLTPAWLNFQILTPPPIEMRIGSEIDHRLRIRGVPVRWRSEITAWQPPFRRWIHTHTFQPMHGGTLVTDIVDYAVPGGSLVERFLVAPDLERIFDYRARQMDAWVLRRLRSMTAPQQKPSTDGVPSLTPASHAG